MNMTILSVVTFNCHVISIHQNKSVQILLLFKERSVFYKNFKDADYEFCISFSPDRADTIDQI